MKNILMNEGMGRPRVRESEIEVEDLQQYIMFYE